MENLNTKLKILRKEKNLSQMDLSRLTGISQSTIANIEKGRNEATTSTLISLSNFFQISVDYLIGREQEDNTIIINKSNSDTSQQHNYKNTAVIYDNFGIEYHYEISKDISNALLIILNSINK